MTDGVIYQAGWTLNDIAWAQFDPSKVNPALLAAVKAASLVEYNAPDYVAYLKRVYRGAPESTIHAIEHWGDEEIQHGLALGRWGELADPDFHFDSAFARFRALYRPSHFESGDGSVRGSRRGEMIARCVVESGTSSLYSAMRDGTDGSSTELSAAPSPVGPVAPSGGVEGAPPMASSSRRRSRAERRSAG